MARRFVLWLGLAALVVIAPAAHAEAALSDAEVRGFVASLQSIEKLAARHERAGVDLGDESATGESDSPMAAAVMQMQTMSVVKEYETLMRRHGFTDAAHWSQVGDRVYRAYFALLMEREAAGTEAELQQALRDPGLNAEDRRAMQAMATAAMAGLAAMTKSTEADKAVVGAHLAALEKAWAAEEAK